MPHALAPSAAAFLALVAASSVRGQALPPVPVPPENPITEAKRVLGKVLFWDAQLSSDNTTACGTCHMPFGGGADPRFALHPGADGAPGTDDDVIGSAGLIRAAADGAYVPDAVFGLAPQVTRRAANPSIGAMYAPELFWDGRAPGAFVDPITGDVLIAEHGALESQALAPIVSDVEMAHEDRDWSAVVAKLTGARPLALATNLPADVAAALAGGAGYSDLFDEAFGDPAISPARIAFAIATYERTLVSDDTRWDRFMAGDAEALSRPQQAGLATFMSREAGCSVCHAPPLFTDNTFRNIGLRPIDEDDGRRSVTGLAEDAGRFKVPTLRNAGLKPTFMHTGGHTSIASVIDFYLGINGQVQFPENRDPLIPAITIPEDELPDLLDFLRNGLVDARVANESFPFDRPTLHTDLPANPSVGGGGVPGSGGSIPRMIAVAPPNLGNAAFKLGVERALGGAKAFVALARTAPEPGGTLDAYAILGPIDVDAAGHATWIWPIPDDASLRGDRAYVEWRIEDPAAEGGIARSAVATLSFYAEDPTECGCPGDLDCDGAVGSSDLIALLARWGPCDLCAADADDDGVIGVGDLVALLAAWGACD